MFQLERIQERFPEAREMPGKHGTEYNVNCPFFHKKGGTFKMHINAEDGVYYCQDCGSAGHIREFGIDDIEAMFPQWFPKRDPVAKPERPRPNVRRGGFMWTADVPAPGACVSFDALPDDHVAVAYLRSRGFDIDEIRQLEEGRKLWYCENGSYNFPKPTYIGSTSGRIIFPVYMLRKMVGWQARQIDYEVDPGKERIVWNGREWKSFKKTPEGEWEDKVVAKYYNSPMIPRQSSLYGFDMARSYREVAVVEGVLDYHKVGAQCVGLLGGNGFATSDQALLLKTYWETLFWVLDPNVNLQDQQTKKKFDKMVSDLYPAKVYPIRLADKKDAGATDRTAIWQQICQHIVSSRQVSHGSN